VDARNGWFGESTTTVRRVTAGDEESIMMRNSVRRSIAAVAVLGAAAAGVAVAGVGTASAMPTDRIQCNAGQLTTTLVAGDPGAGQRYAGLQFTARPGQHCQLSGVLPLTLTAAPGVTVVPDDSAVTPVNLAPGQSAYELLHWAGIAAPADQVTPAGVRVQAPGERADTVALPRNQGPVDDTAGDHTLTVSAVVAGPAPTE
jgi:hypothetical protein